MERIATDATGPDFAQRARFSMVWQDLVTPVRAIVGYQEIIVEEARRLRLLDLLPYLEKVLIAAGSLSELVDRIRDPGPSIDTGGAVEELGGVQAKLRHDLRTPLNAIIGYSEMVLEDLDPSATARELRPDLEKLLGEARQLLDRIDAIIDLTRAVGAGQTAAATGEDGGATEAVVAALLRTLRPERDAPPSEVGRILVVDDNESNRDLLCRRLKHEGHDVTTAESGSRAFSILQCTSFDLILLDLIMPEMNGIEVLERLKSDEKTQHTPVIMISSLSETDAVIRCIQAGAEDYLPKPFNLVLLRARINAALERRRWRERERDYFAADRRKGALRDLDPQHPAEPNRGAPQRRRDRYCGRVRAGFHPLRRYRRVHGRRRRDHSSAAGPAPRSRLLRV